MSDAFTETTHESWFSRIGNSLKSLLIGGVLFLVSFPVLFWNEGRAVKTAKSLNEGEAITVSIPNDTIDSNNEGKLVHTTGMADSQETLRDELFGIEVVGLRLSRISEMYQWNETKHTKSKKKLGGGKKRTTTYEYDKIWSATLIDSNDFKRTDGHANPSAMPIQGHSEQAKSVTLGKFQLPQNMVSQVSNDQSVSISEDNIPEEFADRMQLKNGELYLGTTPASPEIGDVRVRFATTPATEISVVAQQTKQTFRPYQTQASRALSMLELGNHSVQEMFQHARDANSSLTWILRLVGAGMMLGGLMMLMAPLAVLGDLIPFVGTIISGGSFIIAAVITLILASLTIGVAWLLYRPLIAVPLFALAIAGIVFLFMNRKTEAPPEVLSMDDVV